MDIKSALEAEHSKAQTARIVAYVGDDADRLEELMACFFNNGGYFLNQRAAWPVTYIGEKYPSLIEPYLPKMLEWSQRTDVHDAIKRNTVRVLWKIPEIPEEVLGTAVDLCFKFFNTPSVPAAIRAYSMMILGKTCQKIPELKEELQLTIEDFLQYEQTPAFRSAARQVLKIINKKKK